MTLSSSDGWPLTGPNESVRRWPLISLPSTNVSSSSADARRGPRVLVLAQPQVGADDDRDRPGEDEREAEPDQLDVGEAEVRAADVLDDEVLGQTLHQQEADPAQQPDGRQQDLVGAAAGDDLGDVDAEQDAEINEEVERLGRREALGDPDSRIRAGELEGDAAGDDRGRGDDEQAQLAPARPRVDALEDAGQGRRGGGHRRGRSRRIRTWPSWSSSP